MKKLLLYLLVLILSMISWSGIVAESTSVSNVKNPITISNLASAAKDDLIYLSMQAHFNLPDFLIDAVNTGIKLTFIADIEMLNKRSMLPNKKVLDLEWHKDLHFYSLTRHYVVDDVTFNRQANFNSLENAFTFLGHYESLPITEQPLLASSQATHTRVRIKLSRANLPLLLRLKSYILYPRPLSSDWHQWSL